MRAKNCLEVLLECGSSVLRESLKVLPIQGMEVAESGVHTKVVLHADTPQSLMKNAYLLSTYTNFIFKTVKELKSLKKGG